MASVMIAYNNRIDEATLSGGSWTSTLPLNNLKDRAMSKVARSANALTTSTKFNIAFVRPRNIKVMALCRHNFSVDATYRIQAYYDVGLTQLLYDSGVCRVWQTMYSTIDMLWSDDNFWGGWMTEEDRLGFYWTMIHPLPAAVQSQYVSVTIEDTGNTNGYVEIGRVFVADAWQPAYNMSYGASLQYEARTDIEEAWDGTEYFSEKPSYRVARFDLPYIEHDEAMKKVLDLQRVAGISKEVLFSWDSSDVINNVRRSFIGRLRTLSPLENPYPNAYKTSVEIKELL